MRLDKPAGIIERLELPINFLCGDDVILCGSELYTCGGGYVIPRASKAVGVASRETEPVNGVGRVSKPTGTIVRQSEVT